MATFFFLFSFFIFIDKETDIRNATEKIRQQLNSSFKKHEELLGEIASLKV